MKAEFVDAKYPRKMLHNYLNNMIPSPIVVRSKREIQIDFTHHRIKRKRGYDYSKNNSCSMSVVIIMRNV